MNDDQLNPLFTADDLAEPTKTGTYPLLRAGIAAATDIPQNNDPVDAKQVVDLAFGSIAADRNEAAATMAGMYASQGDMNMTELMARDIQKRNDLAGQESMQWNKIYRDKVSEIFAHAAENVAASEPSVIENNPDVVEKTEVVAKEAADEAKMEVMLKDMENEGQGFVPVVQLLLHGISPMWFFEGYSWDDVAKEMGVDLEDVGFFTGRSVTLDKIQYHFQTLPTDKKVEFLTTLWEKAHSKWTIPDANVAGLIARLLENTPADDAAPIYDALDKAGLLAGIGFAAGAAIRSGKLAGAIMRTRSQARLVAKSGGQGQLLAQQMQKVTNGVAAKAAGQIVGEISGVSALVDATKLVGLGARKILPTATVQSAQKLMAPILADIEKVSETLKGTILGRGIKDLELETSIQDFQRQFSKANNPNVRDVHFTTPDDLTETRATVTYGNAEGGSFATKEAASEWAKAQGIKEFEIIPDTTNTGHIVSAEHRRTLEMKKKELEVLIAEARGKAAPKKKKKAKKGAAPKPADDTFSEAKDKVPDTPQELDDAILDDIYAGKNPMYVHATERTIVSATLSEDTELLHFVNEMGRLLGMEGERLVIHYGGDLRLDASEASQALRQAYKSWGSGRAWYTQDPRMGSHHIFLSNVDQADKKFFFETLAHEYGHMFEKVWTKQYGAVIKTAFRDWLSAKGIKAEFTEQDFDALLDYRGFMSGSDMVVGLIGGAKGKESLMRAAVNTRKWAMSYSEFFAEQFSKWAFTAEAPTSVLGQAFASIVEGLKHIMQTTLRITGVKVGTPESINRMMNAHIKRIREGKLIPPPAKAAFDKGLPKPSAAPGVVVRDLETELAGVLDEIVAADDAVGGVYHGWLVRRNFSRTLGYNVLGGFDPEDITSMARYNLGDWAIGTSNELYMQRVVGMHASARIQNTLTEFVRPSLEKLNRQEKMLLDDLLILGDKEKRVLEPNEIMGVDGSNQKVAEAYYRVRALRDRLWEIRNATAVSVMNKQGFRRVAHSKVVLDTDSALMLGKKLELNAPQLVGKKVYDPTTKKWIGEGKRADYDVFELAEPVSIDGKKYKTLAMPRGESTVNVIDNVIPYRPGEYKRIYSDEYFIRLKTLEDVDGEMTAVHKTWKTAKSKNEADAFVKAFKTALAEGRAGTLTRERASQLLEKYAFNPDDIRNEILAGKYDGAEINVNYNRTTDDYINDFVSGRNNWSSERGDKVTSVWGSDTPNTVNPLDAIAAEIGNTAYVATIADWRAAGIQRWYNEFFHELPMEAKRMKPDDAFWWMYRNKVDYVGGDQRRLFASRVQKYMVNELGIPTSEERYMRGFMRAASERIEGAFPNAPGIYHVGKLLRNTSNFPKWLRSIAFHSFFGFNPVQFLVQGMNAVNAMAMAPVHGAKAFYMAIPLKMAMMSDNPEVWRKFAQLHDLSVMGLDGGVDEFVQVAHALKRSGLLDGIQGTAMYSNEAGAYGMFNGLLRRSGKASGFFFNHGEEASRIISFDIARREFMKQHPGKAWWTDQNMVNILKRQDDLTQNMTKANTAFWQRGALSVPLQFTQYQVKIMYNMLGAITGKRGMTKPEAVRMLVGHGLLFGAAGSLLPFGLQGVVGNWINDADDDTKLAVQQGVLAAVINQSAIAMSGEEMKLGIGTRFNTFNFYEKFIDGIMNSMSGDPDAASFFEVAMGASGFSSIRGLGNFGKAISLYAAAPMNRDTLWEGMKIVGGSLSALNNLQKYQLLKRNYNTVVDTRHNPMYKVTDLEAVALGFGILPAAQQDMEVLFKTAKAHKQEVKEYTDQLNTWQATALEALRDGDEGKAKSYQAAIQVMLNGLPIKTRQEVLGGLKSHSGQTMQRKLLLDILVKDLEPKGVLSESQVGKVQ